MRRAAWVGLLAVALGGLIRAAPLDGQVVGTTVGSAIGGTTVSWSDLGPAHTDVLSGTVLSLGGINTTLTTSTGGYMRRLDEQPAGVCVGWCGDFNPYEAVLWTRWQGPLVLSFDQYVSGFGTSIMPNLLGDFTASITVFRDAIELGSYEASGLASQAADGSALFLGVVSGQVSTDFNRVELTIANPSTGDFAVGNGQLSVRPQVEVAQVYSNPEPVTMTLLGTGLLGLAGMARRRRSSIKA